MVLRDKYITEHLYDVGDIVDDVSNNTTGIIIRRGTNYVTLEDKDPKTLWLADPRSLVARWLAQFDQSFERWSVVSHSTQEICFLQLLGFSILNKNR